MSTIRLTVATSNLKAIAYDLAIEEDHA